MKQNIAEREKKQERSQQRKTKSAWLFLFLYEDRPSSRDHKIEQPDVSETYQKNTMGKVETPRLESRALEVMLSFNLF